MKHISLVRLAALIAGLTILLLARPALAQYADDPSRDRIPYVLWETPARSGDLPLSSVMTVNNFDNFNLGVDFAESNMAENPLQPTWFFTAYNTNTVHHTENGHDWQNGTPSFGTTMSGDPVVCYDSLGNLFYENMYGASIQGVKVIKSTDNGATWGASVTGVAGVDKNWMTCDQTNGPNANNIYTCMTGSSGGNFARSTDHGTTFTTTFTPSTQSLPGMMVCVGANGGIQGGSVYVVTNSGDSFNSTYTFYKSTDGGLTFTLKSTQNFSNTVGTQVSGRNSVQNMRTRPYPMIAADNSFSPTRGRLYCTYASNDPPGSGNKPDVWCRYSDDGGTTWSSAIRVNDDASPTTHHQWHPAIWCDKQTGRLYAMWMDTRDCPTSDSALIYASYSDNGGVTWAANQAVSNQKMKIDCPTCGGGGTPRYEGDYNGIISNKKVAMAGWTDFRQGSFMSTTGYFPDFAMAVTPATGSLYITSDSVDFTVSVPAVKLYTDTVLVSAQVTPAPATGTLTVSYPQGNKITTFPGSKIVRVKLTGNVPLSNYQVLFTTKGPNGTPVHQRTSTVTVQAAIVLAVAVTASPQSVCPGNTTMLQAFASGGTPPYTYSWTSNPAGFTSTQASPVASPTVNTWYVCTVHDNVNAVKKDSVYVTILAAPATPGAITGNTAPCAGTSASYSIAPVPGANTYTWGVPAGAFIQSGQTTTSITVQWGSTSGNVTVTAGNSCGSSAPSQLAVTLAPSPSTPGPISGPSTACSGSTVAFNVPPIAGATFAWTVPGDATIISGQGTEAITVHWGIQAGFVSVSASIGACASTAVSVPVSVETLPWPATGLAGPDTVCQGYGGYQYSVQPVSNASAYVWILPQGAVITQGQGTSAVTVDYGNTAVSGRIKVAGSNFCGAGTEDSINVVVQVCTGTGNALPQPRIALWPNPVNDILSLSFDGSDRTCRVEITDANGRLCHRSTVDGLQAGSVRRIDVSALPEGLYLVRISGLNGSFTGKFTVNRK